MIRVAKTSGPLQCFGLWQISLPKCATCPHLEACRASAPDKFQGVQFTALKFDLVPEKLKPNDPSYSIHDDLQATYSLCHLTVFGNEPHDHIGRVENSAQRLSDICEELGCSQQLFIMAVMTAANVASPDRPFFANMLYGPSAVSRFESYREECRLKFGQFDFKAIELTNPSAIRKRFVHSEALFGAFIIDTLINQEGDVSFTDFYLNREMAFDHFWLAIEESYFDGILRPHVEGTLHRTHQTSKLRSEVAQARRVLLKHASRALTTFRLRETVMKEATDMVLHRHRLTGDDFLYQPVFSSAREYWTYLGLAVRRIEILRILGDIA